MPNAKQLIERKLLATIEKHLPQREYLAMVGPRQAGKTTLLEAIKKKHEASYLTFENRKILALFEEDIDSFISLYCQDIRLLLIDEFQYARKGGQNLKYIYDTLKKLKIVITGSSSLELRAQVGKYMVGRILFFNLWPLSFSEFLSFKDQNLEKTWQEKRFSFAKPTQLPSEPQLDTLSSHLLPVFEEYLTFGGYPRVVTTKKAEDKETILNNIVSTYLMRDVRGFLQIGNETSYLKLISALALQTGNLYNLKELSNTTKTNYRKLTSYLESLRQTFVIRDLAPFYTNPRTELTKTPKVYFADLGLRNAVIENFIAFEKRTDRGALAENFVFNTLANQGLKTNFWRTKSKAEIDFIVKKEDQIIPCEVKYQPKVNTVSKPFYSFLEKYDYPFGVVVTQNTIGTRIINGKLIYFYPIYFF